MSKITLDRGAILFHLRASWRTRNVVAVTLLTRWSLPAVLRVPARVLFRGRVPPDRAFPTRAWFTDTLRASGVCFTRGVLFLSIEASPTTCRADTRYTVRSVESGDLHTLGCPLAGAAAKVR
jgi:hypothetical protein